MTSGLSWALHGQAWPHREASEFIQAAGLRWHVQTFGEPGSALPCALLVHGTGASTHSWRGLAPLLAPHFNVLAVDLPGHGFTSMPEGGPTSLQLSLPGMAAALGDLLVQLGWKPALVVGHSAGAAIGVRMCLDGLIAPALVISVNGAFLPLGGFVGQLFSPVAKLLAGSSLVPKLFSWRAADPEVLRRLIGGTGSTLDAEGTALYAQLVSNPGHAAGALGMMANWDLTALVRDLPQLRTRLGWLVGANDRTVSPLEASRVLALLPPASRGTLTTLAGLGHLAHEERPDWAAEAVLAQFEEALRAR